MVNFTEEDFIAGPINPRNKRFRGMFFGKPGTGKTTLAAGIGRIMANNPNPRSTVIVHADEGDQSVLNFPELLETTYSIKFQGYEWLDLYTQMIEKGKFPETETFIFDTYSHMQDDIIDNIIKSKEWPKSTRVVATSKRGDRSGEVSLPGMDDYHYARNAMRMYINSVVRSRVNLILLAHVYEPTPLDNDQTTRPNGTQRLNDVVGRASQVVGYTEAVYSNRAGDDEPVFTVDFKKTRRLDAVKGWLPETQGKKFTHAEYLKKLEAWKAE